MKKLRPRRGSDSLQVRQGGAWDEDPRPHPVLSPLHSPVPHLGLSVAGDSLEPVGLDFVSFLSLLLKADCLSGGPWAASGMRFLVVLSNKYWKELSIGFKSWLCPSAEVWLFIHHNFSETQSLHLPKTHAHLEPRGFLRG